MLAITPNASICARCAIRTRILALQQRRVRNASTRSARGFEDEPDHHSTPADEQRNKNPFAALERRVFRYEERDAPKPRMGRVSKDSPIRRHGVSANPAFEFANKRPLGNLRNEAHFRDTLQNRLKVIKEDMKNSPVLEQVAKDSRETGDREESFSKLWKDFLAKIYQHENTSEFAAWGKSNKEQKLWHELSAALSERGIFGLDDRIKYHFYGHVTGSRFTQGDIRNQQALADLRYPIEWYPATRSLSRTIHLHVGPTNSGKTYHALQRLEKADSGVYAGPLRLLAHEVYSRMNMKGKKCSLITGEERRWPMIQGKEEDVEEKVEGESATDLTGHLTSCTVEMVPLNQTIDVAVIDEIQMIGNAERGWAWTQALLGVKAKEVHLCGEERTVPLIKELCAAMGEKLEIHKYERLSPLQMSDMSLDGDLRRLKKGDCIVSFSVMGIHALRKEIEKSTGKKVATVYGSLPPETRAQQARLFNDPNNDYDYLVASDAVGMGLNLAIKRIIFESSNKFDGISRRSLPIADIKQIAGRAGRFRTALQANEAPASQEDLAAAKGEIAAQEALSQENENIKEMPDNVGLVTTLERFDYPIVRSAMKAEPEPIKTAGLFPPAAVLERFAGYFPPGTPFSYMLTRLHELSQMHSRFHLCGLKDQIWVADLIEPVPGLTISDRNYITSCPAGKADVDMWKKLMPAYARCIANQSGGALVDIQELPLETLELEVSASREYLRELERLHKGIVAYLWLSYRFQGIFSTRGLAFHVKKMVEDKIEEVLSQFSFTEARRRQAAARREKKLMEELAIGEHVKAEQEAALKAAAEKGIVLDINKDEASTEEKMAEIAGEDVAEETRQEEDEYQVGNELDGKIPGGDLASRLDDQTSLTGGGDTFGGEEDIPYEEPEELESRVQENSPLDNTTSGQNHSKDEPGALKAEVSGGDEAGDMEILRKRVLEAEDGEENAKDAEPKAN